MTWEIKKAQAKENVVRKGTADAIDEVGTDTGDEEGTNTLLRGRRGRNR